MPAQPDVPAAPGVSATSPTGVIHDIGYRNYAGVRLGRWQITQALFLQSLRGAYGFGRSAKSKVFPIMLLSIMCLVAFIIAVIVAVGPSSGDLPLPYTRFAVVTQGVLTLFVAAQAPQSFSRDLRFKTVPLYFSRPMQRLDYVLAKYAALSVAVFALLAIPLLIMYVGALLGGLSFPTQTADIALGLVGAVFFAFVLGGVGVVIASVTARRGFGVAGIITVLVLSYVTVVSLQGIIGETQGDRTTAAWLGLLSPITLVDGVQVRILDAETSAVIGPPPGFGGGATFFLVMVGLVAGCLGLLQLRYRKVAL
jgi:ABC-2 type transport system permease protein